MLRGMSGFRKLIITGLLVIVSMMSVHVDAGEEDCLGFAGQAPIECFECTAIHDDHFCNDPFNQTHPELQVMTCKEYCVKWTRKTLSGITLVKRTCSSKLDIRLRKTSVCIEESRPSEGQLCFCDKEKCNAANTSDGRYCVILALLTIVLMFR